MSDEFDRILSATPIEDVIGQHIALKKAGKNFKAKCPFHGDSTPSFHVYTGASQGFHCFGCGQNGDAVDFLSAMLSMAPAIALAEVARIGSQPPPVFRKKTETELRREGLATAIWSRLPAPGSLGDDPIGVALAKAGWPIRAYQQGVIDQVSHATDSEEMERLGLNLPTSGQMLSKPSRAWVFAGRRIASADETPTGFLVLEARTDGSLGVRSRATPSKGSVITCDAILNRWKTRAPEQEAAAQPIVFLTEDFNTCFRAVKAGHEAVCSTAAAWRAADVRDVRTALRSHRLVLDARSMTQASSDAWACASGIDVLGLEYIDTWRNHRADTRLPFLSTRLERLAVQYNISASEVERAAITAAAQSMIEALSGERIVMAEFGRMATQLGLPITYSIENAKTIEVRHRILGDDEEFDDTPAKTIPPPVLSLKGTQHSLLNFALLNLPFVDGESWSQLGPSFFDAHQPVADEIGSMVAHLKSNPGMPRDRVSSLFLTRLEENPQTKGLGQFWWKQVIKDPAFWDEIPEADGHEAEQRRQELLQGIAYAVKQERKKELLQSAYVGTIDATSDPVVFLASTPTSTPR